MRIEIDDPSRPALHDPLNEHLQSMRALSPPDSVQALDLNRLRQPDITLWPAWQNTVLLGGGALRQLDGHHGEVKSMRTPQACRRRGAGRAILRRIIGVARSRGCVRLSLETGTAATFQPAQRLCQGAGFVLSGPF